MLRLQTEANRLAESQAALERKAALYDRLARGEGTEEEEVRNITVVLNLSHEFWRSESGAEVWQ